MPLLALVATGSLAADPTPALMHPSAVPLEAGHGEVSVGGLATAQSSGILAGGTASTAVAVTDRLALTADVASAGRWVSGRGSVRYTVVDSENVQLAPFVMAGNSFQQKLLASPGVALRAGEGQLDPPPGANWAW